MTSSRGTLTPIALRRHALPRRTLLTGAAALAFSSACDASRPPLPDQGTASASHHPPAGRGDAHQRLVRSDARVLNECNALFAKHWLATSGRGVKVQHNRTAAPPPRERAVIDGLKADVVTLALGLDISALAKHGGLVQSDWQTRLPHRSAPYTSTIVLLVRKGNPKGPPGLRQSRSPGRRRRHAESEAGGGARWNYLAVWGWALKQLGENSQKARELVTKVMNNVLVLDSGARGSTTTFTQRGIGDVLITWENEGRGALGKDPNDFEIVVPTSSVSPSRPSALSTRS